jgi:hypothetical protein
VKWHERALVSLTGLSALAMWLPWVWHRAAALVLTGLDLHEFIRFMGEVRTGQVRAYDLPLCMPLIVVALVLAGMTGQAKWSIYGKGTVLAFAGWLVALIYPPLEQGKTLVAVWGLLLTAFVGVRLLRPRVGTRLALLSLAGLAASVPALLQFALLLPALGRLYGRPVTPGVGVYLEAAAALGTVAVLAAALAGHTGARAMVGTSRSTDQAQLS